MVGCLDMVARCWYHPSCSEQLALGRLIGGGERKYSSKEAGNTETKMVRPNKCAVDSLTEGLIVTPVDGGVHRSLSFFGKNPDIYRNVVIYTKSLRCTILKIFSCLFIIVYNFIIDNNNNFIF
jgi:hypothetical protein